MGHRDETLQTMREHAQEFEDEVLFQHVDLYVNEWTLNLGEVGLRTIQRFNELATERLGISPKRQLQVFK